MDSVENSSQNGPVKSEKLTAILYAPLLRFYQSDKNILLNNFKQAE